MSSAHSLQLGRYCRWLNRTIFRIAQLSGCLTERCYAEWQGTSGLAVTRFYTCLAVPGHYASHLEVAVLLLRSCSSCEATWNGWILPFSALKQINNEFAGLQITVELLHRQSSNFCAQHFLEGGETTAPDTTVSNTVTPAEFSMAVYFLYCKGKLRNLKYFSWWTKCFVEAGSLHTVQRSARHWGVCNLWCAPGTQVCEGQSCVVVRAQD